jgi:ABC-2 type transport system ATP-binding protein
MPVPLPVPPPAALPEFAVTAKGLGKVYRGSNGQAPKPALEAFDLAVPRGSFFGLLGPNGAGKSTFINILAGLVVKTSGGCTIWGMDIDRDPRHARAAIGVVPQELNIDPFFTPREALEFQAGMYGVPRRERRTDEILAAMRLTDKADAYARSLSGGMRRRLLVAKAMVHSPPILVLDEPTAGVDVDLRQQLWQHIRALNQRGTTVLLTTHYLEEAQQLCDRVAIINRGKVVACDTTDALIGRLDRKGLAITIAEEIDAPPPALAPFNAELKPFHRLTLTYRPSETPMAEILAAVQAAGLTILDLTTEETDLEDIFLQLTR